jgi:FAD/FMN-containing dehydrogenase
MNKIFSLKDQITVFFKGEIKDDETTIKKYSRDASLLEVRPKIVLFPKDSSDLKGLVRFVGENKKENPELSITGRSAGTDMGGGPLNESIILDFTAHFKSEKVDLDSMTADVEPGVFYRDFELDTLPRHISLPVFPASKQLAALGGMIMNNAAGEKTLRYGQIREFVEEVSMVLADGNEYLFKKMDKEELSAKLAKNDFEGEVYRKLFDLISNNYDLIKSAKPKTSKNSSGYALWTVWDKEKETFDLSKLFVGSQGTLGLLAKAKVRLIKDPQHKKLITLFFKSWDDLPAVVNALLPFNPECMEVFDDATLKLGIRFMPEISKKVGENFFKFAMRFIPECIIGMRMLGLPKLIVLVELAEEDQTILNKKVSEIKKTLKNFPAYVRFPKEGLDSEKYWIMRRTMYMESKQLRSSMILLLIRQKCLNFCLNY